MEDIKTKKILIDGKEVEIAISIPEEEVENNNDLFDLDDTFIIEVDNNE